MAKHLYVQNVHIANARCKIKLDGQPERVIEFRPARTDQYTGTVSDTGYTQVSADDLKLLEKHSGLFRNWLASKLLIVHEDLPTSAKTPAQIMSAIQAENTELRKELAELRKGGKGGDHSALVAENKELKLQVEELLTKNEALEKAVEELSKDTGASGEEQVFT